jgi:glycosyltransferase involved in cell wall biosynthesis
VNRVLIVSHDRISERMAGPAIRCWEIARVLGREFPVTLAVPNQSPLQGDGFEVVAYDAGILRDLVRKTDVVVVSGFLLVLYPFLKSAGVPLVVELYDPFHLENLQVMAGERMEERLRDHEGLLGVLEDQIEAGDFLVCASERQRDFWLGMLSAWNRVNPYTYDDDASLRRLIDVVPFGLPGEPPRWATPVVKGVHPGIGADDQVVLWMGGLYDWLDPLTAVRAVDEVHRTHPQTRLLFLGVRHPNPLVSKMKMVDRTIALAEELGLGDRVVFFSDWVPYAERGAYLLEADVGLSLHLDHLETRFAFRMRLLDYIWAGLPMVATVGDVLADIVERYGLGRVVGVEDVQEVAEGMRALLDDAKARERRVEGFSAAAAGLRWEQAVRPLAEYVRSPWRASDLVPSAGSPAYSTVGSRRKPARQKPISTTPWPERVAKAWRVLRREGWAALSREVRNYVTWRRSLRG